MHRNTFPVIILSTHIIGLFGGIVNKKEQFSHALSQDAPLTRTSSFASLKENERGWPE